MKQVEGTWDATIRIIVWGVPIATVAIGLLILLFACLQPSYTATVKEVGETAYTPSRTMVRGHSSSYYSVMLEVDTKLNLKVNLCGADFSFCLS